MTLTLSCAACRRAVPGRSRPATIDMPLCGRCREAARLLTAAGVDATPGTLLDVLVARLRAEWSAAAAELAWYAEHDWRTRDGRDLTWAEVAAYCRAAGRRRWRAA